MEQAIEISVNQPNDHNTYGQVSSTSNTSQKTSDEAYKAYRERLDEQLSGIDFNLLAELVTITLKNVAAAKEHGLVLIVGNKGAGKTTTLNYLEGVKMEVVDDIRFASPKVRVAEGESSLGEIGEGDEPKTLHPLVVPVTGCPELAYCDCPGFKDTRTTEKKLCSSLGLPLAISYAGSVKAMIVVVDFAELTTIRGEGFHSLAETLDGLLRYPDSLAPIVEEANTANRKSQVLFVFTKVPEGKTKYTIVAILEEKKASLEKRLKELSEEVKTVMGELTKLGVTIPQSQQLIDNPKTLDNLQKEMIARKNNLSHLQRKKVEELKARYQILLSDSSQRIHQLTICQAILANPNSIFIIRCNQQDDKAGLLQHITELKTSVPIPKEQFHNTQLEKDWDLLKKIMDRIAENGTELLDRLTTHSQEIVSLKHYMKLLVNKKAEQEELKKHLKGKPLSLKELEIFTKKLFESDRTIIDFSAKTIEERRLELIKLEQDLVIIDSPEPIRYHHPNLEPVNLSIDKWMRPIAAYSISFFLQPWIPFAASYTTALSLNTVIRNLEAFRNSRETLNTLHNVVGTLEALHQYVFDVVLIPPDAIAPLFSKSHRFIYNDVPFVNLKAIIDGQEKKIEDLNQERNLQGSLKKWIASKNGFDADSKVEDKEHGIFEITARHFALGSKESDDDHFSSIFSIELYVEKRIHPDFKPRIDEIRRRIAHLKAACHSYLAVDKGLETRLKKEEDEMRRALEQPQSLQVTLLEILENRAESQVIQLQSLRAYIRYQSSYSEAHKQLRQQALQYTMLLDLMTAIKPSFSVLRFIERYQNSNYQSLQQIPLATVWGRKQSSDQQPNYQAKEAKVKGDSLGAVFIPLDKPNTLGWLGKIGYKPLRVTSASMPENSIKRRGSALNSMLEKLAMDFYTALSEGNYLLPKIRLAELPIKNSFTIPLINTLYEEINENRESKIEEGVYVISKYIADYQDGSRLQNCIMEERRLSFSDCLSQRYLPESALVEGDIIPLKGLMEILAIGRLLADTDVLGGKGTNVGFVLERNHLNKPMALRAVKIDADYAFNFKGEQNLVYQSFHPDETSDNPLKHDQRHIQYSNSGSIIEWQNLSLEQKTIFIATLSSGLARLTETDSDSLYHHIVRREEFKKTPKGRLLPPIEPYLVSMNAYLQRQNDIYKLQPVEVKKSFVGNNINTSQQQKIFLSEETKFFHKPNLKIAGNILTTGDGNCAFNACALGICELLETGRFPENNNFDVALSKHLNLPRNDRDAIQVWLESNKDNANRQKAIQLILRKLAISYIKEYYLLGYASVYQDLLWFAYQSFKQGISDDTFKVHPFIHEKFASSNNCNKEDLINWWEKNKDQYFNTLYESASSAEDTKRFGSEVEIGALATYLGINIRWQKEASDTSQQLGIGAGLIKNLTPEQIKLLADLGIGSQDKNFFRIHPFANQVLLHDRMNPLSEKENILNIINLITSGQENIFDQSKVNVENFELLCKELAGRNIITRKVKDGDYSFILNDKCDAIDKEQISKRLSGLEDNLLRQLVVDNFKADTPEFSVLYKEGHWSLLKPISILERQARAAP